MELTFSSFGDLNSLYKEYFKFLVNLEVLEYKNSVPSYHFNLIAQIPSQRFKKLKIEDKKITQKTLDLVVDVLKQHNRPIALEIRCKAVELLLNMKNQGMQSGIGNLRIGGL